MGNQAIVRGTVIVIMIALLGAAAIGVQTQSPTYLKGVVTQSNKPVRSVWVIASQYGQERGRYLTGDDGKFYIPNLSSGDGDVVVWQDKQQIYSGRFNLPGDKIFNIVIPPPKLSKPLLRKRR